MATWIVEIKSDGEREVFFKNREMYASAGRCSAATPLRDIWEWIVTEADQADLVITDEGAFALPFRTPRREDVAC